MVLCYWLSSGIGVVCFFGGGVHVCVWVEGMGGRVVGMFFFVILLVAALVVCVWLLFVCGACDGLVFVVLLWWWLWLCLQLL